MESYGEMSWGKHLDGIGPAGAAGRDTNVECKQGRFPMTP